MKDKTVEACDRLSIVVVIMIGILELLSRHFLISAAFAFILIGKCINYNISKLKEKNQDTSAYFMYARATMIIGAILGLTHVIIFITTGERI